MGVRQKKDRQAARREIQEVILDELNPGPEIESFFLGNICDDDNDDYGFLSDREEHDLFMKFMDEWEPSRNRHHHPLYG